MGDIIFCSTEAAPNVFAFGPQTDAYTNEVLLSELADLGKVERHFKIFWETAASIGRYTLTFDAINLVSRASHEIE